MAKSALTLKKEVLPIIIRIHSGAGAKNTSDIEINRQEYQLIKKVKPSGSDIPFKVMRHVLGDRKEFHAKKAGKKGKESLHNIWVQLATKDIPAAFKYARDKKLKKEKWCKSLRQELSEKRRRPIMDTDEKTKDTESSAQQQVDKRKSLLKRFTDDVQLVKEHSNSAGNFTNYYCSEQIPFLNSHQQLRPAISDQEVIGEAASEASENSSLHYFLREKSLSHRYTSAAEFPFSHCQPLHNNEFSVPLINHGQFPLEFQGSSQVSERLYMYHTMNTSLPAHVTQSPAAGQFMSSNWVHGIKPFASQDQYLSGDLSLDLSLSICSSNLQNDMPSAHQLMQGMNFVRNGINHSPLQSKTISNPTYLNSGLWRNSTEQSPGFIGTKYLHPWNH